jgi:hypothetical protein
VSKEVIEFALAQEEIAIRKSDKNKPSTSSIDDIENVSFSFHTAGSGGAGVTILTATFLLLGEDVLVYDNRKKKYLRAASDSKLVDFEDKLGYKEVVRLNLIECESCASSGVKSVETFFGTSPSFWNFLFVLMARFTPKKVLQNRNLMEAFAKFSLPMVRLIDNLVGSKNGG